MVTDRELRQSQMVDVVERLQQSKPEEDVQVLLLACNSAGVSSYRGLCMHGGTRPVAIKKEVPAPVHAVSSSASNLQAASLPTEISSIELMPQVNSLRVGEYMHVVVTSERPGYLHMFNLGMSGSVAKLFPHTPDRAQYIMGGKRLFITQGNASPFTSGMYRELGDSSNTSQLGKANGYPERLLAIVIDEHVNIKAGDFHPSWSVFDASYRSAENWGTVQDDTSWFWKLPPSAWSWGIIEVPVED